MQSAEILLDLTLIGLLLAMAVGTLHCRQTGAAITLFAGFGMVLALTWARLRAPDLALAEAAIGAGLTSVLLLRAASISHEEPASTASSRTGLSWLFVAAVFVWLAIHVLPLTESSGTVHLPGLIKTQLPDSGVNHPVTAVLLNFRAWDTLLELIVLLLALLGFRQIARHHQPHELDRHPAPWPLLKAWSRFLAPLLVIAGGYLLWRGSNDPGGAFQAGAVLASALILLRLSDQLPPIRWSQWPVRLSILSGVMLFIGIGVSGMLTGDSWLQYRSDTAAILILLIESAATVSIAVTLAFLVAGEKEDMTQ